MALKGVAYIDNTEVHHLDHIGVLAATLEIPLITTDLNLYYLGKQFYPQLDICFVEAKDLTNKALANSFDIIFVTNFWLKKDFNDFFKISSKKMRYVHCSHGNSDKGQNYPLLNLFLEQDMVLIYGQRMQEFLREHNVFLEKEVLCGNYRLEYYKKHKKFYDKLILPNHFDYKKTVLFAPTWTPLDSCLFKNTEHLLEDIPDDYCLIFKVHPAFERDHHSHYEKFEKLCKAYKNVMILKDFPAIYPLLDKVDYYVGDASSINYDFLYFNKPMFFINTDPLVAPTFIHQTGPMLDMSQSIFKQIKELLPNDNLYKEIRKNVFRKTFEEGVTKQDIWDKIIWLFNNSD